MKAVVALGSSAAVAAVAAAASGALTQTPTLNADPLIGASTILSGAVPGASADQEVVVEEKQCGAASHIVVERTRTNASGLFRVERGVMMRTSFRVRSGGANSRSVVVQTRPGVRFEHEGGRRYNVWIIAYRFFDGRRGRLERFDGERRRWVLVRRVTLRRQSHPGGFAQSGARFTARARTGWLTRFVLPLDQTRPCYLAGYSPLVPIR